MSAYRFFLVLAMFVGAGGSWFLARRRGLPAARVSAALGLGVLSVFAGARLLHVATHSDLYVRQPSLLYSTAATGFSLWGGLAAAGVGVFLLCRALDLSFRRLADSCAAPLALSLATVRVGCFLEGCCRGVPSSLPWAVTLPPEPAGTAAGKLIGMMPGMGEMAARAVKTVPTHPVAIYEMAAALIGAALVFRLLKRKMADGVAFAALVLWFSVFRMINHPLRSVTGGFTGPSWFYPALYATAALASLLAIIALARPVPARSRGSQRSLVV